MQNKEAFLITEKNIFGKIFIEKLFCLIICMMIYIVYYYCVLLTCIITMHFCVLCTIIEYYYC